jgi:hypothetical protein
VGRRPPKLTAAERRAIEVIARRLGGIDGLIKQIKPRRDPGRPAGSVYYDLDDEMLRGLEVICRVAARDRRMARQAVIRWLFNDIDKMGAAKVFGLSRAGFVKRLSNKLKASGLEKAEIDISGLRLSRDGSCSVGIYPGGQN